MRHVKKYQDFQTNEGFFDSVFGKSKSNTGTGTEKNNKGKDDDLGREILEHIKKMSLDYNRSGKYDSKTINLSGNTYYFIDKFSTRNNEPYKVDIMEHIDYKTNNVPEYAVHISKSEQKNNEKEFKKPEEDQGKEGSSSGSSSGRMSGGPIRVRNTSDGRFNKMSYNNQNIGNSVRLYLNQELAKKIYFAAKKVYDAVTKNPKDDARGK